MPEPSAPSSTPRLLERSLIAALAGNFVIRLDGGIVGQLIVLYIADAEQRGIIVVGPALLGLLSLSFYAVELIFSPLLGAQSDRYGNRRLLLIAPLFGVTGVAVATGGVAATEYLGWGAAPLLGLPVLILLLTVTRICQGFAAAAGIPAILSYLSVRTEGSLTLRGRVMAIFEVTTAAGLLGGYVLGPQLWKVAGPWGFVLTGLIFLSSAFFFAVIRDDRAQAAATQAAHAVHASDLLRRLGHLVRRRDLMSFVPAWLSVNAIVGLWGLHLVYQMRKEKPDDGQFLTGIFSPDVISGVMAGAGIVFSLGIIVWGSWVLGRLRELTVMRLSTFGLFGLAASIYAVNHTDGSPILVAPLLVVVALAVLFLSGFLPAAVAFLARLSSRSPADRGLLMGVYSVVLGLGQAVGSSGGGFFADKAGVDGIILFTVLLGLLSSAAVFWWLNHAAVGDDEPADRRAPVLADSPAPAGGHGT